MIHLDEVDMALAGGISESTGSFGIFASFQAQGALGSAEDPREACRPFDTSRDGIVVSEGLNWSVVGSSGAANAVDHLTPLFSNTT